MTKFWIAARWFLKQRVRFACAAGLLYFCLVASGAEIEATNSSAPVSPPPALETSREFYNAGTRTLLQGKLNDAESLFQFALAKQDEMVLPLALFNLGHVRFAQGNEELKKSLSAKSATGRARAAAGAGVGAIQQAEEALAGNDIQKMVEAYLAGRGVRKEIRAATEAVQRAMEAHGKTLLKWRRALGDFKSAAELNPADTNAVRNAEVVEQAIAKLVDSLRQMQQMAMAMASGQSKLNELLQKLKGRIPAPMMPPGAAGGDEDEELPMEGLRGMKEAPTGGGNEMESMLSPEQAGKMLDGLLPDGKLLPMGQGNEGNPKDRPRRTW